MISCSRQWLKPRLYCVPTTMPLGLPQTYPHHALRKAGTTGAQTLYPLIYKHTLFNRARPPHPACLCQPPQPQILNPSFKRWNILLADRQSEVVWLGWEPVHSGRSRTVMALQIICAPNTLTHIDTRVEHSHSLNLDDLAHRGPLGWRG